MIGKLALRSLTAHPVRSAVLAAGFGIGVGVMAILLGVAQIVLDQARSPALVGGGDVLVRLSRQVPARLLLSGTLQSDALRPRMRLASPWHTESLYLLHDGRRIQVEARGGIPSLERALGDEETAGTPTWQDSPADVAWTEDTPERVIRQIDRFHTVPHAPAWAESWAEWLYFNGSGGGARFYLTFLAGPPTADGLRNAGVRLQLDRGQDIETYTSTQILTEEEVQRAPELDIGKSTVRLEGLRYVVHVDAMDPRGRRVLGNFTIEASAGRLLPPLEIAGAQGWRSGYVVPVMSGSLNGAFIVDGKRISLDGGRGYHDHNWGFWQGVSWQWGQVQQGDLSLIYGRVLPPREAADPDRIPGFVGLLGPDGPLGYATNVVITETNDEKGQPHTISIRGVSQAIDLHARFDVESFVITRRANPPGASNRENAKAAPDSCKCVVGTP